MYLYNIDAMIKKIFLINVVLFLTTLVYAQNATSLRINEIVKYNVNGYQDSYGKRSAWVEIFNTSYATVDIAGCYLTNNPAIPKMYMVPKGDINTKIKPRQHVLFFLDSVATHGTFHTNFTLQASNYIALYNSNGKDLIDEMPLPDNLPEDLSFGLLQDGDKNTIAILERITPSSNNKIIEGNPSVDKFATSDPYGIVMTLTAMGVVFIALIVLYLVFRTIGKQAVALRQKRALKISGKDKADVDSSVFAGESGEVLAVITAAVHAYHQDIHDIEEAILTIDKVARTYSPWSSKIYGLRKDPKS